MTTKPLLVGEDNPYGSDPTKALYPYPDGSAGWRLCRLVMDLPRAEYLRRFERVNLCAGKWSLREARTTAMELRGRPSWPPPAVVLLGRKVAEAFGLGGASFFGRVSDSYSPEEWLHVERFVLLPHPSSRCRLWNRPGAFEEARALLREVGVLPLVNQHEQEER